MAKQPPTDELNGIPLESYRMRLTWDTPFSVGGLERSIEYNEGVGILLQILGSGNTKTIDPSYLSAQTKKRWARIHLVVPWC
jgi:hypothetical protein